MKTVLRTPAMVTTIPADKRTHTPMRSRRGMCRRMMIGIGRMVHSRSARQLITPAAMVMTPSSRQVPSTTSGNVQYFLTGLRETSVFGEHIVRYNPATHMQPKTPTKTRLTKTDMLKKSPKWIDHLYHLMVLSWMRR